MLPMMALLFGLGFLFALLSRYDMVLTMIVVIVVVAVPAVYVGLGLLFMQFELVYDDGVGPLEAMRRSWALVRGMMGVAFLALRNGAGLPDPVRAEP